MSAPPPHQPASVELPVPTKLLMQRVVVMAAARGVLAYLMALLMAQWRGSANVEGSCPIGEISTAWLRITPG